MCVCRCVLGAKELRWELACSPECQDVTSQPGKQKEESDLQHFGEGAGHAVHPGKPGLNPRHRSWAQHLLDRHTAGDPSSNVRLYWLRLDVVPARQWRWSDQRLWGELDLPWTFAGSFKEGAGRDHTNITILQEQHCRCEPKYWGRWARGGCQAEGRGRKVSTFFSASKKYLYSTILQ